jgi:hypothetical protein
VKFSVSAVNNIDVLVRWKVANTNLADRYEIQRSDDAIHFNTIGYVNATSSYSYGFDDVNPFAGRSYYRLRMIEANDNDFSPTVSVVISPSGHSQVIPSPAHDYIVVKTKAQGKSAKLTDMQGRDFMNFIVHDGMRVNIDNIPRGLYFLVIDDGEVVKFSKN